VRPGGDHVRAKGKVSRIRKRNKKDRRRRRSLGRERRGQWGAGLNAHYRREGGVGGKVRKKGPGKRIEKGFEPKKRLGNSAKDSHSRKLFTKGTGHQREKRVCIGRLEED